MNPGIEALADAIAERLAETNTQAPLLDAKQAGALLNVPPSWLLGQARANRVPHVKLGKYVRFKRTELDAWIENGGTGEPERRTPSGLACRLALEVRPHAVADCRSATPARKTSL
jgi:excisionase family DNA binding protein